MKIGVDTRCIEWSTGAVARFLMSAIPRWTELNPEHRYVLYFQNEIPALPFLKHPAFTCKVIGGPAVLRRRRILAEQLCLPWDLRRDNLDLYFGTWYSAPLYCPVPKTVVAAWDISYSTHPEQFALGPRITLSFFSRYSCRAARGVITCSEFDKQQIVKHYGIDPDDICTLRLSVDDRFSPATNFDPEPVRRKYRIPERYLLSVGIYTRRQVDAIIEAFRRVSPESDMGLVIVGEDRSNPPLDVAGLMQPLEAEGRGRYIRHINDDDLVSLYRAARWYVSVSTVDGESMTLKEAMQCGTPVITSPMLVDSVGGNAVIAADPTNVDEMVRAFRRAFSLSDAEYCAMRARGLDWTSRHSADTVARQSLRFLETR